jgi:hypothetical protein
LIWSTLHHSSNHIVGKECLALIGRSLKPNAKGVRRFTPDVSLWKTNGDKRLVGVIEYESSNSSDSRVVHKDFRNYAKYILNASYGIPDFWTVITTLPSKKMKESDWYSWDKRRKRIDRNEYSRMLENPFEYWFRHYADEFEKLRGESEKSPLYVVNLNSTELTLCLPKNEEFHIEY